MNAISEFADGGRSIYETIIDSLRNFLGSIDIIKESKGGAIIFFTRKLNDKLMVKVFPFKKDTGLFIEATKALNPEQIGRILQELNNEKPYNNFSHFENFRQKNQTKDHFKTKVDKKNILRYDKEFVQFDGKELTWKQFYREVINGGIEKNTYEQLFFESGCEEICYIPLPVLSTPFVLLVLNNTGKVKQKRNELLRFLYFRSRDTVSKYLYSRIIDNLSDYLQKRGEGISEEKLVELFIDELSNIILPISYQINEEATQVYYDQWPETDPASEYTLHLLDNYDLPGKTYNIKFNLTSFMFVDMENGKNRSWQLFHSSLIYKANIQQSSLLISKLFRLLYKYWHSLKIAEIEAQRKVAENISKVDINGLVNLAHAVQNQLMDIKVKIEESNNYEVFNQLKVEGSQITLTINRIKLVTPEMLLTGNNQVPGFKYLYHILLNAKNAKDYFSIDALELYEAIGAARHSRPPDKPGKGRSEHFTKSSELINTIQGFLKKEKDEISKVLSKKKKSDDRDFYNLFCIYAAVHQFLQANKAYVNSKVKNNEMSELIERYRSMDAESKSNQTNRDIQNVDLTPYTRKFYKSKFNYKPEEPQDFVRDCFESVLTKLNEIRKTPEKSQAVDQLLNNLYEAGLIKENKLKPRNPKLYTYNQKGIDTHINWEW